MKHRVRKALFLAATMSAAVLSTNRLSAQATPQIEKRVVAVQGAGYFPVLLRLKTGRLIVVYRYGAAHIDVRGALAVSWSDDDGSTWTKPLVAVTGENDHRNPAMVELPNGELLITYTVMDGYDATGRKFKPSVGGKDPRSTKPIWLIRSKDHGATWSKPEEIEGSRPAADKGELQNAYGKMAILKDGSVLMSVYGSWMGHHTGFEHIYRSTDNGHTWNLYSTIYEHVNETGIVALPGNRVIAALRTDAEQKLLISRSADGGKTWDAPDSVTLPDEHPGDLIGLKNGDVLLTFGERNAPRGAVAILSHDGGKTWDASTRMVLADDAPARDCGYPSSVQLPNGRIVTVYYKVDDAPTAPASTSLRAIIWNLPKKGK